jgi:hypothetical protein
MVDVEWLPAMATARIHFCVGGDALTGRFQAGDKRFLVDVM